ncbi:unnamed protein product [Discula destructiva]
MPAEILALIISHPALNPQDVVALGLSSRAFWPHALRHIQQACAATTWAGTPLLVTGTWLTTVPLTLLEIIPHLIDWEQAWAASENRRGAAQRGGRGMCPARRWNGGAISSSQVGYRDIAKYNGQDTWRDAFALHSTSGQSRIGQRDVDILRRSLEMVLEGACRPGDAASGTGEWVLRNRTSLEYVHLRSDSSDADEKHNVYVLGAPNVSVDQALMLRICWGSERGSSLFYDPRFRSVGERLVHGRLAGHCFDVVDLHDFSADGGWRDVTNEIVKEAGDLQAAGNTIG